MNHKQIKICGIMIDENMMPLIERLWGCDVETFGCCEGNYLSKSRTCFTYERGGLYYMKAYILFLNKDIVKVRRFLPDNTKFFSVDVDRSCLVPYQSNVFDKTWSSFVLDKDIVKLRFGG